MATTPTYEELEQRIKDLEKKAVEHKKVKDALTLFSHSVESSIDGIAMGNTKNRITYVNEAFAKMFGYSREELVKKEIAFMYAEDQLPILKEALTATMEGGWKGELNGKKKDGTIFPVSVSSSRVLDDQGNVIMHIASQRDITEQKQTEAALQASEKKYRTLFENSKDAISISTRDGKYIAFNQSFLDLFGYTEEDMMHVRAEDKYSDPNDRVRFKKEVEKTGSVKDFEVMLKKKDGTKIYALLTSTLWKASDGSILGYQGIIRDITKQKLADEALRVSEEKWRSLTETAPFLILTAQQDGTIQFLNHTTTNHTTESRIGTKIFDYIQPDYHSVIRKAIDYVFQTGFPTSYESFGTGPEGPASAWYLTHVGPVFREGRVVAVTMASTDITKAKKVHEALQVSEAQKQAILDSSVDRIRLSDTDMRIIWANQTHERELNISPEDLTGKFCYQVFVGRDTPCPECPSIKAIKSGQIEHAVLIRHSQENKEETTYLDSYAVPLKNESGAVKSCIQVTRNITEQVRAEKATQESEEKYRTLFENSRDAVYITTREGKLVDVNQSLLDLFSLTREEIPDLNVQQLYANPDERKGFQKKIEKKGSVTDFEVKLQNRDGTKMDCLLTSTVWRAHDGSTLGYQGIVRDITEQNKTERALREREEELKIKATNLKEVNIALRVLLKKRDEDKTELEEKVLSNVRDLVVPYLEKLEKTGLNDNQKTYVGILESNLNDIISPFIRTLSSTHLNISPTEIQVANLVKQGKTTKEIAELLHSSTRAIEFHRNSLRNKLGLKNKKANLRSYLLSLT